MYSPSNGTIILYIGSVKCQSEKSTGSELVSPSCVCLMLESTPGKAGGALNPLECQTSNVMECHNFPEQESGIDNRPLGTNTNIIQTIQVD